MYDAGKIIIGLVVFVLLALFPLWGSIGQDVAKPKPAIVKGERCIESADYMRANHMQMLDQWRDDVVRNNDRVYVSKAYKTEFNKSLSNTCMDCHSNKKEFCDTCHDYSSVTPYCWSCHIEPKGRI
jgi:hypothetical protein